MAIIIAKHAKIFLQHNPGNDTHGFQFVGHKFEGIENVEQVICEKEQMTILTSSKEGVMKKVIELSVGTGIDLVSIDVEKPNLESVFLQLTGKGLRD